MKPRSLATVLAIGAATLIVAGPALSKDPQMPDADAMKRWQDACTPGQEHAGLSRFLGKWDATWRIWMGGPGSAPAESVGEAEIRWLLEGRRIVNESKGSMMGMPVQGFSILGYDHFKKKYVASHVDSMTTTLLTSEGRYDRSGDVLSLYGLMDEPLTMEHDKNVKSAWRVQGKDRFAFEVHDLEIGEPNTKVVEVVYTRKK